MSRPTYNVYTWMSYLPADDRACRYNNNNMIPHDFFHRLKVKSISAGARGIRTSQKLAVQNISNENNNV